MKDFVLKQVLEKARKLDQQALTALCEQYYPRVLKFMYYRVGAGKAEDLTGEVFLKVMRSITTQHGNFEAWLFKVARNVIIDKARYSNARPEVEMPEESENLVTDGKDGTEKVDAAMDIQYALSQVNEEQREILTLKFIVGLNNEEISEVTGKKHGAIRAMQFRALSSLKEAMKSDE